MLPEIQSSSLVNLDEVPYRLPSRFKPNTRKNILTKSFIERFFERNHLDLRRCDRDSEDYDNEINAYFNSFDMELARFSFFHDSNDTCMENVQKPLKDQIKSKYGMNPMVWNPKDHDSMNGVCSNSKPMWINRLKKWIIDNPSSAEFLQLSKTATLYRSKMWKDLDLHFKSKESLKEFEKLMKNLELETTETNLEKELPKQPDVKKKIEKKKSFNKLKNIIKSNIIKEDSISKTDSKSIEKSKDSNANNLVKKEIPKKTVIRDVKVELSPKKKNESERKIIINMNVNWTKEEESVKVSTEDSTSEIGSKVTESVLSDNDVRSENDKIEEDLDINESLEIFQENLDKSSPIPPVEPVQEILKIENPDVLNFEVPEVNVKRSFSPAIQKKKERTCRVMFNERTSKPSEPDKPHEASDEVIPEVSTLVNTYEEQTAKPIIRPPMELPPLPFIPDSETRPVEEKEFVNEIELGRDKFAPLLKPAKRRWGKMKQDLTYLVDMERQEAAELRRMKAAELAKKMREKRPPRETTIIIPAAPQFETYEFLSKYCILKDINISALRETFVECDEEKKQWLNSDELILALKGVNPNLKDFDIFYLNMVMKTCDYNLRSGADFQLFSVLAALSIQISALDSWIKSSVAKCDLKLLEKKTYFCRKLWEVNVDPITKTMPLSALFVELKAGGVTNSHIREIKHHFKHLHHLTILDFFTYIPLFILTHTSIVDNPLDMSEKL